VREFAPSRGVVRFDAFEVDFHSGDVRKHGLRIRLQDQPFRVLQILLEHPGQLVAREELQRRIWPEDTFVDFEKGLNNAIMRLREALGDSAESPRFIETLPRRGYRFLAAHWEQNDGQSKASQPIDSIAVLRFENAVADPDTEYLAVGIPAGIIHSLSQIPKLRVIAGSTLSANKDREIDPQQTGRKLNVKALLTGRIWLRNGRLRLQVDLIDTGDGHELWGDHYDRELTELFSMQDEISQEVSKKLRLRLTGEIAARVVKRPTDNMTAYQLYLRGRRGNEKRSTDGFKKAVECLTEAIRIDPGYALAYAELAQCLHMPAYYGLVSPHVAYPQARTTALKALEMDDTLAEAHDALATVMQNYDWDSPGAEKEYRCAIEHNPNYPVARLHYAMHLAQRGRFEEAIHEAREGQTRDPMSGIMNAGIAYVLVNARQWDASIEQALTAIDVDPDVTFTYISLGAAYEQKGLYAEAMAVLQKGLSLGGSICHHLPMVAHVYAMSGDHLAAREVIRNLQEVSQQRYVPPWSFSIAYEGLGEIELAIQELQKSVENRDALLVTIRGWPHFDKLRQDVRFQEIERKVGLRL
jgi:TolB-like protein/Tfp pilus assembly protein PilF